MIANVPWDGSYPWRREGVATTFPNGDTFQVWINPDIKDWAESKSYAGDAKHTYGNEFKCWAEHGRPAFQLADGKTCTSAYICWHMQDTPPPPPPPPPSDLKLKTDYAMSKADVNVRVQGTNAELEAWQPQNAFSHINEDDEGIQCKGASYSIGSDCSLRFDDCFFSARGQVDAMKRTLIEAVGGAVAETRVAKHGHYNGKCPPDGGPCDPGYDFEYGQYTYPETGSILVSVYHEGEEDKATTQARIHWTVSCSNQGFCGAFCDNHLNDIVDFAGSFAGLPAVGSVICAAC
jgi:hypothetical protein